MLKRLFGPWLRAVRRWPLVWRQRWVWARNEIEVVPSAHVSRHAQLGRRVKIDGVDAFIDPCVIGPYTIVGRVVMRSANHHTEFLNLYDVMQRRVIGGRSVLKPPGELVRIGAACWLADNVTILEGVQIGNGVIIGAGSVVTKSVPDYAIAVGNPARVVRYRYPDEIVELIRPVDWWNWSDEKLRANVELFNLDLATVDAATLKEVLANLVEV